MANVWINMFLMFKALLIQKIQGVKQDITTKERKTATSKGTKGTQFSNDSHMMHSISSCCSMCIAVSPNMP